MLVVTRQIHNPANGLRYFLLVGVIGLAVAALVAAALARRFTRPLVAAVTATRRIASGDLDATVPVDPHEDPEFAQLAESINAMGANLVRARDQERQFLLSVSHELRTPLTSIRGYADAVVDGATDDPAAAAAVISAEARRLERLVQDLLDLARLDADRFSLDLQTGRLRRGGPPGGRRVPAPGGRARPRAGHRGRLGSAAVGVGRRRPAGPGGGQPGRERLLLRRAPGGGGGRAASAAGRAVWVVDDGPGIPPDQLARVFERHFISDRVSGRRKGSGLGLAIVAELAAAMGATVRAESPVADGRGTRMVVWLRALRQRAHSRRPAVAEHLRSAGGELLGTGRNRHARTAPPESAMADVVLVTGASAGIGQACADRLHRQGWTVVGASRRGTSSGGWTPLVDGCRRDASVAAGFGRIAGRARSARRRGGLRRLGSGRCRRADPGRRGQGPDGDQLLGGGAGGAAGPAGHARARDGAGSS